MYLLFSGLNTNNVYIFLQILITTFIECGFLIAGVAGSFSWFRGGVAVAIIVNIILIIVQVK